MFRPNMQMLGFLIQLMAGVIQVIIIRHILIIAETIVQIMFHNVYMLEECLKHHHGDPEFQIGQQLPV